MQMWIAKIKKNGAIKATIRIKIMTKKPINGIKLIKLKMMNGSNTKKAKIKLLMYP